MLQSRQRDREIISNAFIKNTQRTTMISGHCSTDLSSYWRHSSRGSILKVDLSLI